MNRYGSDFRWGGTGRYGREYEQWGARGGYDQDFGFRGSRAGSFYDRDFSGYQPRDVGASQPYNYGGGFSLNNRYDREMNGRWSRGYDRNFAGRPRRFNEMGGQGAYAPQWVEERIMRQRSYPSPWNDDHPGQSYGFGLGYGQGRGQFIYK